MIVTHAKNAYNRSPGTHVGKKTYGCNNFPKRGDVWLARVDYEGSLLYKKRPVIIVDVCGDEYQYYECSTKSRDDGSKIPVLDTVGASLHSDTYVIPRVRKDSRAKLSSMLGKLSSIDRKRLSL